MTDKLICLAGDGWGAVSAYKSLIKSFKNIDLLTNDTDLKSITDSSHKIISNFQETNAELVICAGYKPIITKEQLQAKEHLNIHYSLLPKYRGMHSTVWAILNDEKELGLTIHQMTEFIDDGMIIAQHSTLNDGNSTSTYYMEYFNNWIENNLGSIMEKYLKKEITPEKNDKSSATWVGRRYKKDCKIDFSKDHKYLKNFFRALVPPYPLPYIELAKDGTQYSIRKATFIERKVQTHIGRILNIDNEGVYVSSKDGYVILNQITNQNDKLVDFFNFKIGYYLNQEFA